MSVTLRGRATGITGVPRGWRGPLPDLSVRRRLPELDGYASVPDELLHGDFPDLGVLTWALLRLSFDDRPDAASYAEFADALGLGDLTPSAIQQRFQPALTPLLGTWVTRHRADDNVYLYRAVVPPGTGKRYAMLRRSDLALLQLRPRGKQAHRVTVSHLADFARWQLECGQRGWTADSLASIATRWKVGEATLRRSRDALVKAKLLEVTARPGGRYTDLVWLRELHDPHWAVPSNPVRAVEHLPVEVPQPTSGPAKVSATDQRLLEPQSRGWFSHEPEVVPAADQRLKEPPTRVPLIRNLTEGSLTEDLTDLGGASATPLTSVTREPVVPEPQAAPSGTAESKAAEAEDRKLAGRLIAPHPVLVRAAARWRSGMMATLQRALGQGLEPGHVARAIQRVLDEDVVEKHCEIVRVAVKQAWADQRAGMCPECGFDPGEHTIGCPIRAASSEAECGDDKEVHRLILASLAEATTTIPRVGKQSPSETPAHHLGAVADPLQPYLELGVTLDEDPPVEMLVAWLLAQIAGRIVDIDVTDVPARRRALDRSVGWWTSRLPDERHDALELAASQLYMALSTPAKRAS